MGLPIAVGGKNLSSRRLVAPTPVKEEEEAEDGMPLQPRIRDCGPLVAVAVSPDQTLSVTCSVSLYDLIRDDDDDDDDTGDVERCGAEIRVQISPLSEAFSSIYRETLHHLSLPAFPEEAARRRLSPHAVRRPCVVFSTDGRHVACIVPYGHDQSAVVIFQLRRPRATSLSKPPPPRPSYLGPTNHHHHHDDASTAANLIPVATNPRLVLNQDGSILQTASALTDASTSSVYKEGSSVLLVGCCDGSILAVAYRPARVAGLLFRPSNAAASRMIVHMTHTITAGHESHGARGRLAVLMGRSKDDEQKNRMCVVFQSHLVLDEGRADHPNVMVHVEPWMDLYGPFGEAAEWILGGSYLALLCQSQDPRNPKIAQVWALPEDDRPAEPISTLTMTLERLQECQHGSFSILETPEENNGGGSLDGAGCLHYDEESGCLAVSSWVLTLDDEEEVSMAKAFSCVWHWRTNVLGLVLTARRLLPIRGCGVSLLSHLYFSWDEKRGQRLAHMIADTRTSWACEQQLIRKELYDLALLSPSEVLHSGGGANCQFASSLMLSSKSVTFPVVTSPLVGQDGEIEWKEAQIPMHYTSSFGAPLIASAGPQRCRSIAIAASSGLCVLDCSRISPVGLRRGAANLKNDDRYGRMAFPKWRLFGNEAEERSFQVLAMTWWEINDRFQAGKGDTLAEDDIVVAVIAVRTEDAAPPTTVGGRRKYLACWSRRRLDMQSQLLHHVVRHEKVTMEPIELGFPLPGHVEPKSISLLSEPMSLDDDSSPRKAVVMIACQSDDGTNLDYLLFHLQTAQIIENTAESLSEQRNFVAADLCSHGILVNSPEVDVNSSVFLASASFQFDLMQPHGSQMDTNRLLATAAFVRGIARGFDAVLITPSGATDPVSIVRPSVENSDLPIKSFEVSSLWLSQTVRGRSSSVETAAQSVVDSFFVWTVMMCDGAVYCWTVPYLDSRHTEVNVCTSRVSRTDCFPDTVSNGLSPPSYICLNDDDGALFPAMFGTITPVGDSTAWLQEASDVTRLQFCLGFVPCSGFGCMLRCSQSAKHLHREAPGRVESRMGGPNLLDHEFFFLGDTDMSPPAFVSSFFASLLGRANEQTMRIDESRSVPRAWDFNVVRDNTLSSVRSTTSEDTIATALRVLVLRTVELVSQESDKPRSDSVLLATSLFSEVVEAARSLVSDMHFVSLFLGVARQIEPKCLPHLFPLPLSVMAFRADAAAIQKWRSVEDLYVASLYSGSLTTPASALPLLSSKRLTQAKCIELLKRCLNAFEKSSSVGPLGLLDASQEERTLINDLFVFGTKLEDAGLGPVIDERSQKRRLDRTEVGHEEDSSSTTSSFVRVKVPPRGRPPRKSRSICHMFAPSLLMGKYQRAKEEDAIHEAASSFISSGFEESDYEIIPAHVGVPTEIYSCEEESENSVAGTLVGFLLSLCLDHKPTKPYYRWKKARALAHIVLGAAGCHSTIDSSSEQIVAFRNIAALIPLSGFSVLVRATRRQHDESIDNKQLVADLLTVKILECDIELEPDEAGLVLQLILALLARHDKSKDVESCISGLVFLGIIAGHVAGVARELLGASFVLTAIGSSYSVALCELEQAM